MSPALGASLELGNGYGAIDAPRDTDPLTLGQLFCEARMTGDMTAVAPFFAPRLENLLVEAEASPGAFPNGIPWQAIEATPSACTLEILNGADDTIGVMVKISYVSPAGAWADTINLDRTVDSWQINNVFYDGGGNLRFRLFEALDG
jgi:hypothetical protein